MTKAGANYARHMDEIFERVPDNTDQEYAEYLYLQQRAKQDGAQRSKQAKEDSNGKRTAQ